VEDIAVFTSQKFTILHCVNRSSKRPPSSYRRSL